MTMGVESLRQVLEAVVDGRNQFHIAVGKYPCRPMALDPWPWTIVQTRWH
jgi:hypothetical protein